MNFWQNILGEKYLVFKNSSKGVKYPHGKSCQFSEKNILITNAIHTGVYPNIFWFYISLHLLLQYTLFLLCFCVFCTFSNFQNQYLPLIAKFILTFFIESAVSNIGFKRIVRYYYKTKCDRSAYISGFHRNGVCPHGNLSSTNALNI